MYYISEEALKEVLIETFKAIVGEECKRIEILQKQSNISGNAKLELFKDIIKEINYESMRGLKRQLKCFSDGYTYFNVNLKKPIAK